MISAIELIDDDKQIACIAPLIRVSWRNTILCEKNPTLLSLSLGFFATLKRIRLLREYDSRHKNLQEDYQRNIFSSEYLSGCFMVIPFKMFKRVGGFSKEYFLHLEDADITRKLSAKGKTIHFPLIKVRHGWARGSHKSLRQIYCVIKSYIVYSIKWGFRLY